MNPQIANAIRDLCITLDRRGVMRDPSYEKMGVLIHESIAEDQLNNHKSQNEQDIYNEIGNFLQHRFWTRSQTFPSLNIGAICEKIYRRFILLKNQI